MIEDKSQENNLNSLQEKEVFPMKEIRESVGMSQVKFAAAIGIDPKTVSRAENGLTEPVFTVLQMKKFCRLVKKSIEEIPDHLGKNTLSNEGQNGSQT